MSNFSQRSPHHGLLVAYHLGSKTTCVFSVSQFLSNYPAVITLFKSSISQILDPLAINTTLSTEVCAYTDVATWALSLPLTVYFHFSSERVAPSTSGPFYFPLSMGVCTSYEALLPQGIPLTRTEYFCCYSVVQLLVSRGLWVFIDLPSISSADESLCHEGPPRSQWRSSTLHELFIFLDKSLSYITRAFPVYILGVRICGDPCPLSPTLYWEIRAEVTTLWRR